MFERLQFFIHPVPLAAVALMALNDHWLKYQYPGWITGKLSDFCGVFYLPIFVLALTAAGGVRLKATHMWGAIACTDILMIAVKLFPAFARGIESEFTRYLFPIRLISDPTDLLALSMNFLTVIYLTRMKFDK